MKNLFLSVLFVLATAAGAQTLNDKGLYVDSEGELFSGTVSRTQNGLRSEFQVKNGVISGDAVYYAASGKVLEKGSFTDGKKDQKWIRYNDNGSISAVAFYAMGKKSGTWLVFDDKGNKRYEMNYTNGEKSGVWTSWDESGKVLESKDYASVN